MDVTGLDKMTGQDFFFSCPLYFFPQSFSLLTFFLCFIALFQSCCSHAQVFGKTLVHEFLIFYSHTEWDLLSSGTDTLSWWRSCYKTTKLQTNTLAVRNKYRGFIEKIWSKREEILKMRGQPAWCGEEKITPCCLCVAHRLKKEWNSWRADRRAKGRGEEIRRKDSVPYKGHTGQREPGPLARATACEVSWR